LIWRCPPNPGGGRDFGLKNPPAKKLGGQNPPKPRDLGFLTQVRGPAFKNFFPLGGIFSGVFWPGGKRGGLFLGPLVICRGQFFPDFPKAPPGPPVFGGPHWGGWREKGPGWPPPKGGAKNPKIKRDFFPQRGENPGVIFFQKAGAKIQKVGFSGPHLPLFPPAPQNREKKPGPKALGRVAGNGETPPQKRGRF